MRVRGWALLAVFICSISVFAQKEGDARTICIPSYNENIGTSMAYPDGTDQAVFFDCTGTVGCDAYFDMIMAAGDTIFIATCGAEWDTALSIWSGPTFEVMEECVDDACGLQTELSFTAPSAGTYRLRVGGFGGDSGPVDLVYNGDRGIEIVGGIAPVEVPTLSEYGMGALLLLLALAGLSVIRANKA